MTYIDPALRDLFALAKEHNAVFIWDGTGSSKLHSIDMDRLGAAVDEEDLAPFQRLLGGAMIRLPVIGRVFWAPAGNYEGYKGE